MDTSSNQSFRDSIATVNQQGKRVWVYPKKPSGNYFKWRKRVSYLLVGMLFAAPFIKINGNQFLLFNVIDRKFIIFGLPFWPQDFYLLVLSLIIGVVFVTLFTVSFGRIFCGWVCPQTIFMEMVFRRIEYWIDGDRGSQIRLAKQKWNGQKIRKRLLKWFVFFLVSLVIANVFLAYIIGSDQVLNLIRQGPFKELDTFIGLLIFTSVFYFVFTWFREQVCVIACPYGRLQGVLLDRKSIVVAYDYLRGESKNGRAKFKKSQDRQALGIGDCIDCGQCVQVCPTGIDIRNGTQLECVNCTACMDACDHIMQGVGMPKGLIRYASEDGIAHKEPFRFTPRLKGYTAVLGILIGILAGLLFLRTDLEATILRLPGQSFEHKQDRISNVYTYKIVNKTVKQYSNLVFKLENIEGEVLLVGQSIIQVPKEDYAEGTLFIEIPQAKLQGHNTKIRIGVYEGERLIEHTSTNFLGPRVFN